MIDRFTVISGCSGGGKSTLLAELARRGFGVVDEPGRRIVREEVATGGSALPWADPAAFLHRAISVALADHAAALARPGRLFFDRGLVDALVAREALTGEPAAPLATAHRYDARVFLTPPWPALFASDDERRHTFDAAVAEYERLRAAWPALGYEVLTLPQLPVPERADWLLAAMQM